MLSSFQCTQHLPPWLILHNFIILMLSCGTVSLISFWVVYYECIETQLTSVCWLCILLLCWIHLFIVTQFVCVCNPHGFTLITYDICEQSSFYFFIYNLDAFYFFFLPKIALATISNTILNRSGKSRHSHFLPEITGKAFYHSPLNMSTVDFSQMSFIVLR